jgi:hypothetical protein
MHMIEWSDLLFLFDIAAFIVASIAVRCWRELGILTALSALLIFPIKWIGPGIGLAAFGQDAVTYDFISKEKFLRVTTSPALLAAIILGSLVMIAWKRRAARGQAEGAGEG